MPSALYLEGHDAMIVTIVSPAKLASRLAHHLRLLDAGEPCPQEP
jgi:hypothetical protein